MKRNQRPQSPAPGRGITVKAYLEHPDRYVTRLELWEMLRLYESGKRRLVWWRKVLRWARRPVVGFAPITPQDSE